MSEFVQTMKDWRRMCQHMSDMFGDSSCDRCPLVGCAAIYEDTEGMDYADVKNKVDAWAAEHPEPVYPTWGEWLIKIGGAVKKLYAQQYHYEAAQPTQLIEVVEVLDEPIPADIAQKLGIEPKGGSRGQGE